jgi:hypothetical protein
MMPLWEVVDGVVDDRRMLGTISTSLFWLFSSLRFDQVSNRDICIATKQYKNKSKKTLGQWSITD